MPLDVAKLVRRRATDEQSALRFEEQDWSYREFATACAQRANLLLALRREGPFHLGGLLDNVPEYPMLLGAAAAGERTMTGSSGPGISLMQETFSYLAGSELPCVIADVIGSMNRSPVWP